MLKTSIQDVYIYNSIPVLGLNVHVFTAGPDWGHDVLPLLHQQPPAEQPGQRVHQLQAAFHLLIIIIRSVTHKHIVKCTLPEMTFNVTYLLLCRGAASGAVLPGGRHRWWGGCVSYWPRSSSHRSEGCTLAGYGQRWYPLIIYVIAQ